MDRKNARKLQESARRFREMAVNGDDPRLKAALLQLADEFEEEAVKASPDPVDDHGG